MSAKKILLKMPISITIAAIFLFSEISISFAHRNEFSTRGIPHGYRTVRVGRDNYFYHGGHFYTKRRGFFEVIIAPIGAIVPVLAVGFTTLAVAGIIYYVADGVYYRRVQEGYMVVEAPVQKQESIPPLTTSGIAIVQIALLNVRSGPATTYSVIDIVKMGERLTIKGSVTGWYNVVLSNGKQGWVMTQFTSLEQVVPQG